MNIKVADDRFTMNTAALKTVNIDAIKINSDIINADDIFVDDENIIDIINNKKFDISKLITRTEVIDSDNFILWDNTGQPCYIKLAQGTKWVPDFEGTPVRYVNWDFSSANKWIRFKNCYRLTKFKAGYIPAISCKEGFAYCSNLKSIEFGENAITDFGNMCIRMQKSRVF